MALPDAAPEVFLSIKTFFEEIALPLLPGLTQEDIFGLKDLEEITQESLEDFLSGRRLYGLDGLSFSSDVYISAVTNEADVEDISLKEIDQDEILITITGKVELDAHGFIEKNDYYMDEIPDENLYIIDGNHNDHVMHVGATIITPFQLSLTYDKTVRKISGSEVELLDEIHPHDYY